MFEIVIVILVVVGLIAAFFFCGSDRRDRRGSRDHLRMSQSAAKTEEQMERHRDYVSDREKRRTDHRVRRY